MVATAERNSELVADLAAQRPALGKAQVMGIAGLPATNQAGLLGDMPEVAAIANPPDHGQGKGGFVDRLGLPSTAFALSRDGLDRPCWGGRRLDR